MTSKEIRNWRRELGWKDEDPNIPLLVQIEIAAQLAELNENLKPRPNNGQKYVDQANQEPIHINV